MLTISLKTTFLSFIVFLLFAGSFITSLFFKENLLWMDETLSYLVISDASLAHMNDAVVSGFEQTPPFFANLFWLIAHTISLNIVFLKAVSIIFFAITIAFFYYYTTSIIGISIVNFFLITGIVAFTYLNVLLANQLRSYVVFFFVSYFYFIIIHKLIHLPDKLGLLVVHTCIGLLLVLTHNFGLFYLASSGSFFALLLLWSKDIRYWYVLGTFAVISIIWLLAWYPNFVIQAKTGEPHSWIPLPNFQTFFQIVGDLAPTVSGKIEGISPIPVVPITRFIGLAGLFIYIINKKLKSDFINLLKDTAFTMYLLSGFIHATIIIITLFVSFFHTSLFLSRYLWPSHLLVVYQLVYAFYYIINSSFFINSSLYKRSNKFIRLGWVLPIYIIVLSCFLFYQSKKLTLAPKVLMSYIDKLDKKYPVFLETAVSFMPIWFYNKRHKIYFLLDYNSAFDSRNELAATVGYHTLEAVKKKYNVNAIIEMSDFNINRVPHFFIVDESWNYQIERFIQNKSVRVIRTIPTTLTGYTILECVFIN